MPVIIAVFAYFLALALGLVGWVMNILTIIHTTSAPITGLFVARVAGIFIAPLGAVLGWF